MPWEWEGNEDKGMKRVIAISFAIATLLSVVWVAVPMALIYPFLAQTPARLAVGHALRVRSAPVTMVLLVLGLVAAFPLWRRLTSRRGRVVVALGIAALASCAWLGWSNTFEMMFHPLPHPEFASAEEAKEVADEDLVLGVRIGNEARAYPVRAMAYHHLVNDVIAGEPIVATY